jgi:hypothetical protein
MADDAAAVEDRLHGLRVGLAGRRGQRLVEALRVGRPEEVIETVNGDRGASGDQDD